MSPKSTPRLPRPTAIDLFCGAGGMSLGFEQAGFDILSAVDIDPIHVAVHSFNFPECNTIWGDISKIAGTDLIGNKQVDVVLGGPPCQGFSLIGKRDMDDPRNDMISQFVRIVKEIHPRYFVMENVYGLAVGKAKSLLSSIVQDFSKSGYGIVSPYWF
jgi:DNA (cytosine-5)-methyltransferase 1